MKLKTMLRFLGRFVRAQEAVSALEYAIIVGVVVAGVGGALAAFTGDVEDAIEGISTDVTGRHGYRWPRQSCERGNSDSWPLS